MYLFWPKELSCCKSKIKDIYTSAPKLRAGSVESEKSRRSSSSSDEDTENSDERSHTSYIDLATGNTGLAMFGGPVMSNQANFLLLNNAADSATGYIPRFSS